MLAVPIRAIMKHRQEGLREREAGKKVAHVDPEPQITT